MTRTTLNERLLQAAENGDIGEVNELIAGGAEVNAINEDGETPLHVAAEMGDIVAIQQLITAKADVNAKDKYGKRALHLASLGGHTEIVESLIAAGADVNIVDGSGQTPLHMAASNDHTKTVESLIAAGADINAKDIMEKTPLHWAVLCLRAKALAVLIAKGADINAKDNKGKKPRDEVKTGSEIYNEFNSAVAVADEIKRKEVESQQKTGGSVGGSHAAKVAAEGQSVPSQDPVMNVAKAAAGFVGGIFEAINTAIPKPPSHAAQVTAGRDEKRQNTGCAIS